MLAYAQHYLASKLVLMGNRAAQDVALNPYFQRAVGILFDGLQPVDESGKSLERPVITPGPAGKRSTRHGEFFTGRQPWPVVKCHLNAMVADTKIWEQAAATALDAHPAVRRWVKNDHLGFQVLYLWGGSKRKYVPDFLIRFKSGQTLALEIKGVDSDQDRAKRVALGQWVEAVNAHGGFGTLASDVVVAEAARVRDVIDKHAIWRSVDECRGAAQGKQKSHYRRHA